MDAYTGLQRSSSSSERTVHKMRNHEVDKYRLRLPVVSRSSGGERCVRWDDGHHRPSFLVNATLISPVWGTNFGETLLNSIYPLSNHPQPDALLLAGSSLMREEWPATRRFWRDLLDLFWASASLRLLAPPLDRHPRPRSRGPPRPRLAAAPPTKVSQLRSVLPVRQSGNMVQPPHLVFSTSGQQLTVCTCAKCGSTSVFRWLYESIYGQPFVARDPLRGPWVQNVQEWKAPPAGQINTPSAGGLGSYNFTIVRDPLERYFSAWKSKIQCNRVEVADGNHIVPELLKLAGLPASKMIVVRLHDTATTAPAVSCLRFADFALALRAVHARGAQDMLDRHLLPQTLTGCSQGAQKTIAEFEKATSVIAGRFGLREVAFPHAHAEDEKPALKLTRGTLESELCAIVAPEYAWMEAAEAYKKRCVGEQGYRPLAMPFTGGGSVQSGVRAAEEAAVLGGGADAPTLRVGRLELCHTRDIFDGGRKAMQGAQPSLLGLLTRRTLRSPPRTPRPLRIGIITPTALANRRRLQNVAELLRVCAPLGVLCEEVHLDVAGAAENVQRVLPLHGLLALHGSHMSYAAFPERPLAILEVKPWPMGEFFFQKYFPSFFALDSWYFVHHATPDEHRNGATSGAPQQQAAVLPPGVFSDFVCLVVRRFAEHDAKVQRAADGGTGAGGE